MLPPSIRIILIIAALASLLSITGCETPEGGSSLPWNRPQPWEHQGIGGVGY
jgi:hypothetical protein